MKNYTTKLSDREVELVDAYTAIYQVNIAALMRNLLLERILADMMLDGEALAAIGKEVSEEEVLSHEEVWGRLGLR